MIDKFASYVDRDFKVLVSISLLLLIIPLITPFPPSWLWMLIFVNYYVVVCMSWNIVLGYTGQFSFAHHGLLAIGGYSSVMLVNYLSLHPLFAVFLGAGIAALIGLAIGVVSLRLRGIYFALTTFGFSYIVYLIAQSEYQITGGKAGLKTEFLLFKSPFFNLLEYYLVALTIMVAAMSITHFIVKSKYGLFFTAIREDEDAAAIFGVNIVKIKLFTFLYSSFLTGLMGGFYAHIIGYISPAIADTSVMGTIIIITVIGGLGSFFGPLIGAFFIWPLSEFVRSYSAYLNQIIFTLAVVLTLKFMPNGLFDFIHRIFSRFRLFVNTKTSLS